MIALMEMRGVTVVQNTPDTLTHVTGHPSREELVELIGALNPTIVLPVHGEQHHQDAHEEIAQNCGVDHTAIPCNGDVYRLSPAGAEIHSQIECNYTIIDQENKVSLISKEELFTKVDKPASAIALISLWVDQTNMLEHTPTVSLQALRGMKVDDDDLEKHAIKSTAHLEHLLKELPAELQSDSVHTLRRYLIGKVNAFHEEHFGQQIPSYIHIIKSGDAPQTNRLRDEHM
jgi:ribonuclease J